MSILAVGRRVVEASALTGKVWRTLGNFWLPHTPLLLCEFDERRLFAAIGWDYNNAETVFFGDSPASCLEGFTPYTLSGGETIYYGPNEVWGVSDPAFPTRWGHIQVQQVFRAL